MKTLFVLIALLCGCVNKGNIEPQLREDLTEQEIASLHEGITAAELFRRTHARGLSEISLPIFAINIKDQSEKQCIVFFDEKNGRILCALKAGLDYGPEGDVTFIWPQQFAGQEATEAKMKLIETRSSSGR